MRVKFPKHISKNNDTTQVLYGTGEVAGVIQACEDKPICLLIADDESHRFIIEKACECFKID